MSVRIEKRESKHGFNCVCCRERVRTCEKFIAVVNNATNRPVRGERYCIRCEEYAVLNNEDEIADTPHDDGEADLRAREAYAAYSAAGCASAYWGDRDAGYVG